MGRRRLGVVCLLDPPVGDEVDGLRRALGDVALARIRPHVTLVPPVNVTAASLDAALGCVHDAASAADGPLRLTVGPVRSFLPVNPVLLLGVGGDLAGLGAVRDAAFRPPLERRLAWPWVPHVTLADGVDPERIAAATDLLADYASVADIERVTLLEERRDQTGQRRWRPLADALLGGVAVVGRGGVELRLVTGRCADPASARLLRGDSGDSGGSGGSGGSADRSDSSKSDGGDGDVERGADDGAPWDARPLGDRLVVGAWAAPDPTGRAASAPAPASALVGAAVAWRDDAGGHVRVVVAPPERGRGIGSRLLAALETAARRQGWGHAALLGEGPAGFYRARSAWTVPVGR